MEALSSALLTGDAPPSSHSLHSAAKTSPIIRRIRRSFTVLANGRSPADLSNAARYSSLNASTVSSKNKRSSVETFISPAQNWLPINELPPTPCFVIRGTIPSVLRGGAYVRNGPNPQHLPRGNRHIFEGDGMLHSLYFPTGDEGACRTVFCSRFVKTYRYLQERNAGKNFFPNIFSEFQGYKGFIQSVEYFSGTITGKVDIFSGIGQANTSLAYFGGRLFALDESDLPYAVYLSPSGDLTTIGRWNFDGKLLLRMTAHPKKDPISGEVFALRYDVFQPFLTYFRFDAEGRKQSDVPIFSLPQCTFIHDFSVTKRYAIFCDSQIVVQPLKMFLRGSPLVAADAGKISRIGLLPRYATSEKDLKWFDAPGFNPLHFLNAWEEDDGATIVLVASNARPVERLLDRLDLVHSTMEMVTINIRNGSVFRIPLSSENLELGVTNPKFVGSRTRYVYCGWAHSLPNLVGVVKLDMQKKGGDCVVATRTYGSGRLGGEPFFVPAPDEGDEEDDGYLITYVHDENTGQSSFLVMDARSPDLEVVAEVALPRRVPYGFHGIFLTEKELQAQKSMGWEP